MSCVPLRNVVVRCVTYGVVWHGVAWCGVVCVCVCVCHERAAEWNTVQRSPRQRSAREHHMYTTYTRKVSSLKPPSSWRSCASSMFFAVPVCCATLVERVSSLDGMRDVDVLYRSRLRDAGGGGSGRPLCMLHGCGIPLSQARWPLRATVLRTALSPSMLSCVLDWGPVFWLSFSADDFSYFSGKGEALLLDPPVRTQVHALQREEQARQKSADSPCSPLACAWVLQSCAVFPLSLVCGAQQFERGDLLRCDRWKLCLF